MIIQYKEQITPFMPSTISQTRFNPDHSDANNRSRILFISSMTVFGLFGIYLIQWMMSFADKIHAFLSIQVSNGHHFLIRSLRSG